MDAVMSELPTGTVTLLLADVEGSTRLWETQPEVMKAAVARLDQTLSDARHRNVSRRVGLSDPPLPADRICIVPPAAGGPVTTMGRQFR